MIVELLKQTYQILRNKHNTLKIKEDMSIKEQETTKVKEPQIYVWGKTEKAGTIVVHNVEKSDAKYMAFTDGSKCATHLVDEMLILARNQDDANNLALSFNPAAKVINDSNEDIDHQAAPDKAADVKVSKFQEPIETEINVMMEMLRKMSAKNHASMPVKVNIPSKEVYDLFKDQMDITKKDLNSQIGLLVESQIDNLREQLKEQIESFIKNYYNGTTTKSSNAKS